MNDTPQGDGNFHTLFLFYHFQCYDKIRMNDTPQGDGNQKEYIINNCDSIEDKNE